MNEVIEMNDSIQDILVKMSKGNPGALSVCSQIFRDTPKIDPDNVLEGFGAMLSLDSMGIRGSKIWMLYKDVCKENISSVLAVVRGVQLGIVSSEKVEHAIENRGAGIDLQQIIDAVKVRLPAFVVS